MTVLKTSNGGTCPGPSRTVWSPDSKKVVVIRYDYRHVPKAPIVDYLGAKETVQWLPHPWQARTPIERTELCIVDIASKEQVKVNDGPAPFERAEVPDMAARWFRVPLCRE